MTYLVECKNSETQTKVEAKYFAKAYSMLQEFVKKGKSGWCTIVNEFGEEECTCVLNFYDEVYSEKNGEKNDNKRDNGLLGS